MSEHSFAVIKLVAPASPFIEDREFSLVGKYVIACDVDAHNGIGQIEATGDRWQAQRFPNVEAALLYWQRVSRVQPLRDDGKPNRPLTAWHALIETIVEGE